MFTFLCYNYENGRLVMDVVKKYKSKYKIINQFLDDYKINIVFGDISNKVKIVYDKSLFIINKDLRKSEINNCISDILLKRIPKLELPDYYYTNIRIANDKSIYISENLNFKIKRIDSITANSFVVYYFYKLKSILMKYNIDELMKHYSVIGVNETLTQLEKHCNIDIEDYFYITSLKDIIKIYYKEVDKSIDYKNPSFKDGWLLKYLNNYFSKLMVVDYDANLIKEFLEKYYLTAVQSEDRIYEFIDNMIYLYELFSNAKYFYQTKYNFRIDRYYVFLDNKAKVFKNIKLSKYFDKLMKDENNYEKFMFILELLEPTKSISEKKKIINYITIIELLIVNDKENISKQIQNKCLMSLKNNTEKYSKEEIKLIYDYRSKIIHGENSEAIKKLNLLANLEPYQFTQEDLEEEIYYNRVQMLESRVEKRVLEILKEYLKLFITNPDYINIIKSS